MRHFTQKEDDGKRREDPLGSLAGLWGYCSPGKQLDLLPGQRGDGLLSSGELVDPNT